MGTFGPTLMWKFKLNHNLTNVYFSLYEKLCDKANARPKPAFMPSIVEAYDAVFRTFDFSLNHEHCI